MSVPLPRVGAVAALAAAGAVGLALAPQVAAVAVAVLLVLDLQGLLHRAQATPLLPASLLLAVGTPALALTGRWSALPILVVGVLGLAVVLVLLAARRRGVALALGVSLLAGLLPGLGAAGLVLLEGEVALGAVALAGLVAAAEAGRAGAMRLAGAPLSPGQVLGGAGVVTLLAGLGMHLAGLLDLRGEALTGLGALAVLGVAAAGTLRGALARPGDVAAGVVLLALGAVAVAAPLAPVLVDALR